MYNKGIFTTTSSYYKGAIKHAENLNGTQTEQSWCVMRMTKAIDLDNLLIIKL